jgi:alpha-tubulin suppressor-like RCC1 family protein
LRKLIYCLLFILMVNPFMAYDRTVSADSTQDASLKVQSISVGTYHTLALLSDGTVMSWGLNTAAQLGVGTTGNRNYATLLMETTVEPLTDVVAVAAAAQHSLALKEDGTVYSWGNNGMGQLGRSGTTNRPGIITGFDNKKIVQISTSDSHSLALDEDGQVWGWGLNMYGQTGNGSTAPFTVNTPVKSKASATESLSNIVAVAAGQFHSLALTASGEVISWGMNTNGQLGDGTQSNRVYPVSVMNIDGTGYLTGVKQISAKGYNSLAVKTDGTLWAWGDNSKGQLGKGDYILANRAGLVLDDNGNPFNHVKQVAAGFQHTVAIRDDGTLWTWGSNWNLASNNDKYQLGRSWDVTSDPFPGQVTETEDGSLITEIEMIDTGNTFTSYVRTDGSVWSVGGSSYLSLGGNRTGTSIQKFAQITLSSSSKTTWTSDTARSAVAGNTVHLSIQLADQAGNVLNIGTDRVRMTADKGVIGSVAFAGEGTFTASFRSEQVGPAVITASVNGLELSTKLTIEVSPDAPSASTSTLQASPNVTIADGTSSTTLTLELLDTWGNAMTASVPDVSLATTQGTLSVATEIGHGKYEAQLTSMTAGTATVSVLINNVPLGVTKDIRFLSGDPDASTSVFSITPISLPANGTNEAAISLTLNDSNGNALTQSGGIVEFITDLGEISSVTETVYGSYSAQMKSLVSGKATVQAMRGNLLLGQPIEVNFVPLVTRVEFDKSRYETNVGINIATQLTAHYWDGATNDVTSAAAYSVSDPSIATVSSNGVVSGHKPGEVSLTAQFGGSQTSATIVVKSPSSGGGGGGTDPGTSPGTNPGTNLGTTPNQDPDLKPDPTKTNESSENSGNTPKEETKQTAIYTDISGHWAVAAINEAISKGWAIGYPNNQFRPNQEITRAEFVKLLINALGYTDLDDIKLSFKDDQDLGVWARNSIVAAVKHKLISGYSDGSFRPNATISRIEITVILVRALGLSSSGNSSTKFADDSRIPAWAKPYAAAASDLGIVKGRNANLFAPDSAATRAEAIIFIQRLLDLKK